MPGSERVAANVIDNNSGLSVVAGRHGIVGSREFWEERAGHGKMHSKKFKSQDLTLAPVPLTDLSRGIRRIPTGQVIRQ